MVLLNPHFYHLCVVLPTLEMYLSIPYVMSYQFGTSTGCAIHNQFGTAGEPTIEGKSGRNYCRDECNGLKYRPDVHEKLIQKTLHSHCPPSLSPTRKPLDSN